MSDPIIHYGKIEGIEPLADSLQHDLWGRVYEIAENQWSFFHGKIDREGFISWCMEEFNISQKEKVENPS